MAQKVNPISVRLNPNRSSDSSWFSDHYYRELLYRDVNSRYYFGFIFPRIRGEKITGKIKITKKKIGGSKFDPRLGRCIIHHEPKMTLIHVFFSMVQRRPPLFFGRRHRRRRQSTTGRHRLGAIRFGRGADGTERKSMFYTHDSRKIKLRWASNNKRSRKERYGYPDRSPSIRKIKKRFLRVSGWKASKHSTLFAATAQIMSLVVQYFFRMKNQIHSDPTTVNISDDNLVTAFCSKPGDVVRARPRFAKRVNSNENTLRTSMEKRLCTRMRNTKCTYMRNTESFIDARRRLYIGNARFMERKIKRCSHCCWKEIRPWWPRMQSFSSNRTNTNISIKPVRADFVYQSASLIAEEITWEPKKRKSSVQICTSIAFEQIRKCKYVKGIRICCSGRLNGAEIAQTECMKEGSTSLHVSSDCIDYAKAQTSTRYGILGVKVWIPYYPNRGT
uniref:Small ribosomal subunit protein uS3m n=1 Tax=Psilotum nudum TaxID=3240 RepID=A0A1B3TRK4_PSINU|nr:ribosomal protein S3 [Psilotum nudum]AOH05931.1 ribosomal protein S3 [Psilotum nudum]